MIYLIDGDVKSLLAALKKHAEDNPWTAKLVQEQLNGNQEPPGDTEGYHTTLWGSIKVVFTISEDPTGVKARVMSFSNLDEPKSLPHPSVIQHIIEELGYKKPLDECMVQREQYPGDDRIIIKVAEIIQ